MISGVNHITVSVNDMDESFRFYVDVLGFKPIQKNPRSAYLSAGDLWFVIERSPDRGAIPAQDLSHIALSVDQATFDAIRPKLVALGSAEEEFHETVLLLGRVDLGAVEIGAEIVETVGVGFVG